MSISNPDLSSSEFVVDSVSEIIEILDFVDFWDDFVDTSGIISSSESDDENKFLFLERFD